MKKLAAILAAFLYSFAASAQPSIEVQVPNLVGVNEQFNLTFVITGDNESAELEWEPGADFQLVWGPQKGTAVSRVTDASGTRTTRTYTYTYILLPRAEGRFNIPAATFKVGGREYTSDSPVVEVVADNSQSSSSSGQSGSSSGSGGDAAQTGTVSSDDIFMVMELSKNDVMVGETVTATLKLYQRVNLVGFENVRFPSFNGCWSQETQAPSNLQFKRESRNGKIYNTAVLRSWNIIPQQPGNISIDPAELVCLVNIRVSRPSTGSIFDDFFQNDYQTVRKRVTSAAQTLRVSRLPDGAPDSFGGGVGRFNMTAALSRDELSVHEASSLEIRVTGSGNIALLSAPKVNFPSDFEVYDVKTSDIPGGKLFEYPFIPRSHGEFTISPVEYSYLDISTRKYVTLRSGAINLSVQRGNASPSSSSSEGVLVPGIQRRDVQDVGSDIRFISTKTPSFRPAGSFFVGSPAFWLLLALLLVLATGAYFLLSFMAERRADVAGSKNRGAVKMARKRLAQAEGFLKKNLYTAFYEELHRALLGYVADKFNMDVADMNKENISEKLGASGVPGELVSEYIGIIDACEFARYAPDSGHGAMEAHYKQAMSTISSIEGSMKKYKGTSGAVAGLAVLLMTALPAQYADARDTAVADSLWTAGVEAFQDADWYSAIDAWNGIVFSGLDSKELYYNLGNAYFKAGDVPRAILNYERALKSDPSYSDARYNLELAQGMVQDKIDVVPELFLSRWFRSICWIMPSWSWAVLGIVFFALVLVSVLIFLLSASSRGRSGGFVLGLVTLVLAAFSLSFAFWQRSDSVAEDTAIVMQAVTTVRSSPSENTAKDLFVLHEGTKVEIIDRIGDWVNIEIADGRQGWMHAHALEII